MVQILRVNKGHYKNYLLYKIVWTEVLRSGKITTGSIRPLLYFKISHFYRQNFFTILCFFKTAISWLHKKKKIVFDTFWCDIEIIHFKKSTKTVKLVNHRKYMKIITNGFFKFFYSKIFISYQKYSNKNFFKVTYELSVLNKKKKIVKKFSGVNEKFWNKNKG